jgi:hypothetical protein
MRLGLLTAASAAVTTIASPVFAARARLDFEGNWAERTDPPLVKKPEGEVYIGQHCDDPPGYSLDDQMVFPDHAINCACELDYVYDLEDLKVDAKRFLTEAGAEALRG